MESKELTVEQALNEFYVEFCYTRVNMQGDCLSYKIPMGYTESVRKEAEELIERLGLPLVAKAGSEFGVFKNLVLIEGKPLNNIL